MSTTALVHPFRRTPPAPRPPFQRLPPERHVREPAGRPAFGPRWRGEHRQRRSPLRAASSRSASSGRSRAGATSSASTRPGALEAAPASAPRATRGPSASNRAGASSIVAASSLTSPRARRTKGSRKTLRPKGPQARGRPGHLRWEPSTFSRTLRSGSLASSLNLGRGLVVEPANEPDQPAGDLDAGHVTVPVGAAARVEVARQRHLLRRVAELLRLDELVLRPQCGELRRRRVSGLAEEPELLPDHVGLPLGLDLWVAEDRLVRVPRDQDELLRASLRPFEHGVVVTCAQARSHGSGVVEGILKRCWKGRQTFRTTSRETPA